MILLEYKLHGRSVQQQNLILDEYPSSFDPNNNQLTSYLWTGANFGPHCRFKYTVTKDICTTNKGKKLAAKCIFIFKNIFSKKMRFPFLFQSLMLYVIMENKISNFITSNIKTRLIN